MANVVVATASEIDEFINGALVLWLESCLPRPEILSGYSSLLDGWVIHSVWLQIDPEPNHNPSEITDQTGNALCIARAKNFECIVRNLKTLFEEELGQTILVIPDAFILGYHPETKQGLEQMKVLLTLLLGAAVQCPNQEIFIARIKELDFETQHAIMELIKQVTDNFSLVLTRESIDVLDSNIMYNHIQRLTKERDNIYSKWISSICTQSESVNLTRCIESNTSIPLSPVSNLTPTSPSSSSTESNHMAVELADLKSKLRKLRQELEEKGENQLELREELQTKIDQYEKLRSDSQSWYAEAKRAAAYRDEVDVLREQAERAKTLENEVQKLREKLNDAEFYKTRVEELRTENEILMEGKEMLDKQVQRLRKRSEHALTLESEIIKYKQKLNDLSLNCESYRSKIDELSQENAELRITTKNLNALQHELSSKSISDEEDECNSGDNSLSEQLKNNAKTRILQLELENRRLTEALDQMKESSFHESSNKILDLEKEKRKLTIEVERLQEKIESLSLQNTEFEKVFENALEENKKLQDNLDSRQKSYETQCQERELERSKISDLEKQVETLTKEKQRIQTLNESIQRRADNSDRLLDAKTKEIDKLIEKSKEFQNVKNELEEKLNANEREISSLSRDVAKLKHNLEDKSVELDEMSMKLETKTKEIERLMKDLSGAELAQQKIAELEKQNQELISQRDIHLGKIETLRKDLVNGKLETNKVRSNLEKLGLSVEPTEENNEINVKAVVEKLVRNPETFKTVREIMLTVSKEQEITSTSPPIKSSDMCVLSHRKEIYTVEKNIELAPSTTVFNDPQELSVEHKFVIQPERLTQANRELNALNVTLRMANEELEAEKARLSVDVATLGSQISSLNTQHVALQLANSQLAADKDELLKQNEAARQKNIDLLHDQKTLECLHDQLSSEYDALSKEKEQLKSALRDVRNDARSQREHIATLENKIDELKKLNDTMRTEAKDYTNLRTEHSKLADDFRNLFTANDRLQKEYKARQEHHKIMSAEFNKLKLENSNLTEELNSIKEELKISEINFMKKSQESEMLMQVNYNLDTDRKVLMDNLSQLLSQYHELLSHSLEDKQHFHEEEKSYRERLHNLSRQKEKLEEKIMEHYKKSGNAVPKKKPFGSGFVRTIKKAGTDIMNKVPSRNRRSMVDDSRNTQIQSMIGLESAGNDSDNSTEEPMSIASDSNVLQRNISIRQSLQRPSSRLDVKGTNKNSRSGGDGKHVGVSGGVVGSIGGVGGICFMRNGTQKRMDFNQCRRNSVHGLEAPDVTGSSLTLGTAGSRRTVYLIDETQKLPDTTTTSTTNQTQNSLSSMVCHSPAASTNSSNSTSNAEPQTPTNNVNNNQSSTTMNVNQKNDNPTTLLMYNRINTTVGGNLIDQKSSNSNGASGLKCDTTNTSTSAPIQDEKLLRKRAAEDKSNSIWYEYGCV